jgi:hypothetical protein
MTAIAFIVMGAISFFWYTWMGRVVIGPLTVWMIWWMIPFFVAGWYIWREGGTMTKCAWLVMAAYAITSQLAWATNSPYLARAVSHVLVAWFFARFATRTSHLWISIIFLFAVEFDLMAYLEIIPSSFSRGVGFVRFAYPDLLAGVSHAASIILASPFDGGSRRRDWANNRVGHNPYLVRYHRRDRLD